MNLQNFCDILPPRQNLKKEDYVTLFRTLGNHFIVGGDFNVKNTFWGSRLSTTKGRELYKAGFELKFDFQSSGTPTYWPADGNKLPDLIDFYVVKGISSRYIDVKNCKDLTGYHDNK